MSYNNDVARSANIITLLGMPVAQFANCAGANADAQPNDLGTGDRRHDTTITHC